MFLPHLLIQIGSGRCVGFDRFGLAATLFPQYGVVLNRNRFLFFGSWHLLTPYQSVLSTTSLIQLNAAIIEGSPIVGRDNIATCRSSSLVAPAAMALRVCE